MCFKGECQLFNAWQRFMGYVCGHKGLGNKVRLSDREQVFSSFHAFNKMSKLPIKQIMKGRRYGPTLKLRIPFYVTHSIR